MIKLKKLDISHNHLSYNNLAHLFGVLRDYHGKTIHEIDYSHNTAQERMFKNHIDFGVGEIVRKLGEFKNLKTLNLFLPEIS